ncbi:signal peptidase I [Candidatus Gracilibacteria bacterium]|nr:signal peptidase I [Candidatus Gracilibacteria bacterium]
MNSSQRFKNFLADLFDMLSFLVFVGGIVLFVRFFVANPYTVVGASMSPTFEENDFIIVDKITPRFGELNRGDVIVFVPPGKTIPYIKRVIGLPGEIVKLKDNGIYICKDGTGDDQCSKLEEDYIADYVNTESRCGKDEFPIESGLFVMGDNRGFSTDSLCCFGIGCYDDANYTVPSNYIIGKVYVRIIPNFSSF